MSIKIKMPDEVNSIINRISENNGKAYAVGGCIRDFILGKIPNDWDIATNLYPEKVIDIFKDYKVVAKGIEFGTVSVFINEEEFEITTFREDCGSKDCRHPESVKYSKSIQEDLSRRDFTMNAMAYNETEGLIDCFGGYDDLKNGVLRAVGNPNERFREDALRMMRAIRQAAQHGLVIESETYKAIKENSHLIEHISNERFNKELTKTLESDNPQFVEEFYKTGISDVILPELSEIFKCTQNNPNHFRGNRLTTVGEHTIDVLKSSVEMGRKDDVFNDIEVRLALLLHDFGKPKTKLSRIKKDYGEIDSFFGHPEASANIAEEVLKRLRYPKKVVFNVCKLVLHHDKEFTLLKSGEIVPNGSAIRKVYADFGGKRKNDIMQADILMRKLFAVKISDALGQNPDVVASFNMKSSSKKVSDIKKVMETIEKDKNILNILLPVNGDFISEVIGLSNAGKKKYGWFVGEISKKIQDKVIKDNTFLERLKGDRAKQTILDYAKSMGLNKTIPEEFLKKNI